MQKEFVDQLGMRISIPFPPQRIISLVPSITELICDLGLQHQLVGRTKFCVHPKRFINTVTKIGGTKKIHIEKIKHLQPDIIIANKEENIQGQIMSLSHSFPVWISDVPNFESAIEMIRQLGVLMDREEKALQIITQSETLIRSLQTENKRKVAYLIWQNPYMTIGRDTYISNMLELVGLENIFGDQLRYPTTSLGEIRQRKPDIILLSSEPFPFQQKHLESIQTKLPTIPVKLVDGEVFSWYGTRLLKSASYLQTFVNTIF